MDDFVRYLIVVPSFFTAILVAKVGLALAFSGSGEASPALLTGGQMLLGLLAAVIARHKARKLDPEQVSR